MIKINYKQTRRAHQRFMAANCSRRDRNDLFDILRQNVLSELFRGSQVQNH